VGESKEPSVNSKKTELANTGTVISPEPKKLAPIIEINLEQMLDDHPSKIDFPGQVPIK
jgi:hypothetical protein